MYFEDTFAMKIEKVRDECSTLHLNQNEWWEVPAYSKSEINEAGVALASKSMPQNIRDHTLSVLNNWRAAHAYPLYVFGKNLRQLNPDAIVVQRLKRLESITGKIRRFPDMRLYSMQDLGGCRVIVDSVEQVYEAVNRLKGFSMGCELKREDDYIRGPKDSGYRSYHMVYKFSSDENGFSNENMLIEVQFRTKLQHMWATAVEAMGVLAKSDLKSGQGEAGILKFFALMSSIIAIHEKTPVCPGTSDDLAALLQEVKQLDRQYKITDKLGKLDLAVEYSNPNYAEVDRYYLLAFDCDGGQIYVRQFRPEQFRIANEVYNQLENETDMNVVLVSAKSFDEMQKAYPNYSTDVSDFVQTARNIINII